MQRPCLIPYTIAIYSASEVDNVTGPCSVDLQVVGDLLSRSKGEKGSTALAVATVGDLSPAGFSRYCRYGVTLLASNRSSSPSQSCCR